MKFEISEDDALLIIHYLKTSQSSQFGTCKRLAEALIAQLSPAPPAPPAPPVVGKRYIKGGLLVLVRSITSNTRGNCTLIIYESADGGVLFWEWLSEWLTTPVPKEVLQ